MKLAGFIFTLLGTIAFGWTLIPLIWCIPMCVKTWRSYKTGESISTGWKVCILLFCDIIAGIILLCDTDK